MRLVHQISKVLAASFVLATVSAAFAADDGAWTVSKSSGDVWLTSSGAQPASLRQEEQLRAGDTVTTGRNGRVLLKRGDETMLISPNSVVGMPTAKTEGLSTTIVQQAGSILLEVEKRNVKHFEVETPYLAAVVKGTQFRVTINAGSTSVDVIRGQVEVADFRSGQIAQVMPGQHATAFLQGKTGLSLSGSGTFNPIEQGKPRTPGVEPIHVPRGGITAPIHATGPQPSRQAGNATAKPGAIRISSSMGEVRLNFHRVTHGLARDTSSARGGSRNVASANTIWGASPATNNSAVASSTQTNVSTGNSVANSNASVVTGTSTAAASSVVTTVAAVTGSDGGTGTGPSSGTGTGTSTGNSGNGNDDSNNGNNGRHRGWGNGRDFWDRYYRFSNGIGIGIGRNH